MKKKPGLPLEQHEAWGVKLYAMDEELRALSKALSASYRLDAKALARANKALDALHHLRSALDDQLFREHPGTNDQELARVYYRGLRGEQGH